MSNSIHAIHHARLSFYHLLTAPSVLPPPLSSAHDEVLSLLQPSLSASSTSALSVLLIGPSGSGKSLLLTNVLSSLQSSSIHPHVVTLHGLLHNSPTTAWRAVAAQLCPQEAPTSQAECLAVIDKAVSVLREQNKPLLLVFDMFERFVNADPLTQNVLYALFNLLQDVSLRAACVAMTTHVDVADGLEKRVKSRFAAREVIVPLPCAAELMSFLEQQVVTNVEDRVESEGGEGNGQELNQSVEEFHLTALEFIGLPLFRQLVAKYLYRSRVAAPVLHGVHAALGIAYEDEGEGEERTRAERLDIAIRELKILLLPPDARVEMMQRLTAVEVALLIALKKVAEKKEGRVCFGDVFKEYGSLGRGGEGFLSAEDGEATVGVDVADKCWERLVEEGLVARMGHGPKHMRRVVLEVGAVEVERLVQTHPSVTTRMQMWAKSGGGG